MRDSSRCLRTAGAGFVLLALSAAAQAEDGYRLWLRYDPLPAPLRQQYAREATEIFVEPKGPTATIAATELERGLSGLLGSPVQIQPTLERDGAVVLALANSPDVESLHLGTAGLGREGFLLKAARVHGRHVTLVVANSDNGLLYGAFALLRRIELTKRWSASIFATRPPYPFACSTIGTISIGPSSVVTPVCRSGIGRPCRSASTRDMSTTRALMPQSASMEPSSITSTPTRESSPPNICARSPP